MQNRARDFLKKIAKLAPTMEENVPSILIVSHGGEDVFKTCMGSSDTWSRGLCHTFCKDMVVSVNRVVEFPGAGLGRLITINSELNGAI